MGGGHHDSKDVEGGAHTVEDSITKFFQSTHTESGKTVQSHELLVNKPETIGIGSFAKVRLAQVTALPAYLKSHVSPWPDHDERPEVTQGIFAIKAMKKTEIVRLKQVDHVKSESLILHTVNHPFIVNLYHRYQDERFLYLVEEFVQCGQLFEHIQKNNRLPNEASRFFAAQMVMAVQALHQEDVIYRDLNPENVMLDQGLYVKLVDFGLAKTLHLSDPTQRTWTLCGTPEYLAPEIIQSKGHSKEVDWWALGILIHEMLAGYPPWYDKDAFQIYKQVLAAKINVKEFFPNHFETHARDLVKKLLTKERVNRIGSSKGGAEDIKKHKWYRGLNWAALYNKQLPPPMEGVVHEPRVTHAMDVSQFKHYPTSTEEGGPVLDDKQNDQFFNNWHSICSEADLSQGGGK